MIIVAETLGELADSIVYLGANCNAGAYPTEFQTYEEGWDSLAQSLDHLRDKLGDPRHAQLREMAAQAKTHYEDGYALEYVSSTRSGPGAEHIKLGSWLLQDMQRLVAAKQPFAYPEELYRWPR